MKEMRKFWLTLASIISFTSIALYKDIDLFDLGLGIGILLTPSMAANAMEWRYKKEA